MGANNPLTIDFLEQKFGLIRFDIVLPELIRHPVENLTLCRSHWIPAFAGMTNLDC
jgi:hypothetical protein